MGYTSTQLLGGALADRFGGKVTLQGALGLSALFTAAVPATLFLATTGAARTFSVSALALLSGVRFLLGAAEGGMLPSMNALVAKQAPKGRKAEALGVSFVGFQMGNVAGRGRRRGRGWGSVDCCTVWLADVCEKWLVYRSLLEEVCSSKIKRRVFV